MHRSLSHCILSTFSSTILVYVASATFLVRQVPLIGYEYVSQ